MGAKSNKELKLWNGRAWCCYNHNDPLFPKNVRIDSLHVYACGHSRADVMRMITEYTNVKPSLTEIRDYWHAGCWGKCMDGIEPERGIWIQFERFGDGKPRRVWPPEAREVPMNS